MKTPRSMGPRGILCLAGLLVLSSLPFSAASAPEPALPDWLQVRMKETPCSIQSSSSPVLDEVRSVLSAALASDGKRESVEAELWNGLDLAFGSDMTQTAAPVEYVWVFVHPHWFRQCVFTSVFEIDFGAQGTVVVTSRGSMPTP